MGNAYGVIARNSLQKLFGGWPLFAALSTLPLVLVHPEPHQALPLVLVNLGMTEGLLAFRLGVLLKEQFGHPRAALIPHFRVPHLIVAAVFFWTLLILP